jgi:hypothetical protein
MKVCSMHQTALHLPRPHQCNQGLPRSNSAMHSARHHPCRQVITNKLLQTSQHMHVCGASLPQTAQYNCLRQYNASSETAGAQGGKHRCSCPWRNPMHAATRCTAVVQHRDTLTHG